MPARVLRPKSLIYLAAVVLMVPLGETQAQVQPDADPQVCSNPDQSATLFAERLGRKRIGFGLTPTTASVPGPTFEMYEGDCLVINLVNHTRQQVGIHAHGVAYTFASDGTPHNQGCVSPGRAKTYFFEASLPGARADGSFDPGSAGYWHYHDHCMGTPHGTVGLNRGLFGAIIIRREGDRLPDREPFVLVMGPGTTFNLRRAPNAPLLRANEGDRVEFVVISHGDDFHTFHLHGHRWSDNRTGEVEEAGDIRIIDNKTLGPADSFGFQVIAGEGVGPAAWMYHCHVQGHSDAGMAGLFLVANSDGTLTDQERAALRRFRRIESGGHHP
ncbi:MAG: multicopper oxidase domain-containing protein [Actinomycetota bacterium]